MEAGRDPLKKMHVMGSRRESTIRKKCHLYLLLVNRFVISFFSGFFLLVFPAAFESRETPYARNVNAETTRYQVSGHAAHPSEISGAFGLLKG